MRCAQSVVIASSNNCRIAVFVCIENMSRRSDADLAKVLIYFKQSGPRVCVSAKCVKMKTKHLNNGSFIASEPEC